MTTKTHTTERNVNFVLFFLAFNLRLFAKGFLPALLFSRQLVRHHPIFQLCMIRRHFHRFSIHVISYLATLRNSHRLPFLLLQTRDTIRQRIQRALHQKNVIECQTNLSVLSGRIAEI